MIDFAELRGAASAAIQAGNIRAPAPSSRTYPWLEQDRLDMAAADQARVAGDKVLWKRLQNRVHARQWRFEQAGAAKAYHREHMRLWRKRRAAMGLPASGNRAGYMRPSRRKVSA